MASYNVWYDASPYIDFILPTGQTLKNLCQSGMRQLSVIWPN